MKTAFLFSEKSRCVSHHVGCVIVKDGRIISSGINGTPPGLPNCCEVFDINGFDREEHHIWSKNNEVHSEANSIAFSAKNDINIEGSTMYVTISPCNECLKLIIMAGIKNVYYLFKYDKDTLNPVLLQNIKVEEIPNAEEIKEWVFKNNLLFVSKPFKK